MSAATRDCLLGQFDLAHRLLEHHLATLTTDECLWRPAHAGPHVSRLADGRWVADWPDDERYQVGPPSIAWLTWHILYWWSMVLDHTLGEATLRREAVAWPGDAERVRAEIGRLGQHWRAHVARLTDGELAKNAAEIGYARFLHGSARPPLAGPGL